MARAQVVSTTLLTVLAPPDATVAPPGYYMMFVVSNSGVPSVAKFVHVMGPSPSTDALPSGGTLFQVRVSLTTSLAHVKKCTKQCLPRPTLASAHLSSEPAWRVHVCLS